MSNTKNTKSDVKPKQEVKPEPKAEMKAPAFTQTHYIGPSIKGVITTNTTYIDGVPAQPVAEIVKRTGVPEGVVKALFVPIEKLSAERAKLEQQSRIAMCYKELAKALNE